CSRSHSPLLSNRSSLGLTRSDVGAASLAAAGPDVHRGSLNDDFSRFEANREIDRQAIDPLGSALAALSLPLIVASGTCRLAPGRRGREEDAPGSAFPRNRKKPRLPTPPSADEYRSPAPIGPW